MKYIYITPQEYDAVAEEMAHRVYDLGMLKQRMQGLLKRYRKRIPVEMENITVSWYIDMTTDDLLQIVAREREKEGQ